MFVCMHVSMHICMYVCVYVCASVWMHVHVCACVSPCMWIRMMCVYSEYVMYDFIQIVYILLYKVDTLYIYLILYVKKNTNGLSEYI